MAFQPCDPFDDERSLATALRVCANGAVGETVDIEKPCAWPTGFRIIVNRVDVSASEVERAIERAAECARLKQSVYPRPAQDQARLFIFGGRKMRFRKLQLTADMRMVERQATVDDSRRKLTLSRDGAGKVKVVRYGSA